MTRRKAPQAPQAPQPVGPEDVARRAGVDLDVAAVAWGEVADLVQRWCGPPAVWSPGEFAVLSEATLAAAVGLLDPCADRGGVLAELLDRSRPHHRPAGSW